MISIICLCNNKKVYNQYLKNSLANQRNCSYELLLIDNKNNKYSSASKAFNEISKIAKGDLLMFVHQDIELTDEYTLNKIEDCFKQTHDLGIIGIAGAKGKDVISNIYHSEKKVLVSSNHITEVTEVNSLDECLFVVPKDIVLNNPFDEEICNNWHLYAVEYCYRMKTLGKKVAVLPVEAYHVSYGDFMSEGYYQSLELLAKKYHNSFKTIDTTIRSWSTNPLILKLNLAYLRYKNGK